MLNAVNYQLNLLWYFLYWKYNNLIYSFNDILGLKSQLLPFLAHLAFRPCELLSSLFVRHPSVNISHFNLLLRNHWTNCSQTLVEWSLDGPLSKVCPVIPTSNQDGHQAENSYMARSSLTYIPGFFCEIFLSANIYRLCKLGIFW